MEYRTFIQLIFGLINFKAYRKLVENGVGTWD